MVPAAPTVLATRHPARAGDLVQQLQQRGLAPMLAPLREPRGATAADGLPWEQALAAGPFDAVVLTSANALAGLCCLQEHRPDGSGQRGAGSLAGLFPGARILCVGQATARAAARAGLEPEVAPGRQSAAGLLEAWPADLGPGHRVLVVRGMPHRPELVQGLRSRGLQVQEALAYVMVDYPADQPLLPVPDLAVPVLDRRQAADLLAAGGAQAVLASSPELLRALHGLGRIPEPVACIGQSTARQAQALGLEHLLAETPAPHHLAEAARRAVQAGL